MSSIQGAMVVETPASTASGDRGRDRRFPLPAVVSAVVAAAYVGFRAWSVASGSPRLWPDSVVYQRVARSSLLSVQFWAAKRPPLMPLLYKVAGTSDRFMWLQLAVSCTCWLFLAAVVTRFVPPSRRVPVAVAVLAFSCATPIIEWDRLVLSESLALSTMVAVVACLLLLIERVSLFRVGIAGAALVAFTLVRDTDLIVTASIGAAILIVCAFLHFKQHRRGLIPLALLGLLALGVAGVTTAIQYVKRDAEPMRNVLSARILPYPDRLDWFAEHGMPDATTLQKLAKQGQAAVGPLANSADTRAYRRWIADHDAARVYREWLLTHPVYFVTAPFDNVGRSFPISHYRPDDFRGLPGPLSSVLFPSAWWLALWGVVVLIGGSVRRCWSSPLWRTAIVVALLAVPHALAAWHGDAVEMERHLFPASVQVRLAIVLATCAVLSDVVRRRSGGHQQPPLVSPRVTASAESGS